MEMLWYIDPPDQNPQRLTYLPPTAPGPDAHYPVCSPVKKQGIEKAPSLLLGSVSEV